MNDQTPDWWRRGALALLVTLVVAYSVGLVVKGDEVSILVDVWLALASAWAPVAVGLFAARRVGPGRIEVSLAAAALAANALGDTWYIVSMDENGSAPYPSVADIGYVLFYVLLLCALAVLVNRQLRGSAWTVLLDTAVGSLGAATVLAVLLGPVFEAATAEPLGGTVIAAAYPLLDLFLVAAIAGIVASHGQDAGNHWMLLVAGLTVLTFADVTFAVQPDLYTVGTPLDAGWTVGIALVALWVDGSSRRRAASGLDPSGDATVSALAVPLGSTLAGLGVLVLASQADISIVAVALAGGTMALAVVPLMSRQRVLNQLARTDDLTGLPNRRAFKADVPARLSGREDQRSALLLLDLDRFKEVNDSLGHEAGDRLLIEVGIRLSRRLRAGDLLARIGGDEFAILLTDSTREDALAVTALLQATLAEPIMLEGIALQTSASVGISLYPSQGTDLNALLRKADMAMYRAKTTQRGNHVYDSDDDSHGEERLRTLEEVRLALLDGQLVLHYQPQLCLCTGQVQGVEALVRWNHPVRGLLQPDQFVPLIDEAGLTHALTTEVLRQGLDQAAEWQAQGHPLTVAVNLAASCLVDVSLPERVAQMISARGLPPSALALEITEDFLLNDRDRARGVLARLRDQGVRISVDDFGTGYSSLAYLRDLPIDELKLDQSFVAPMLDDARAATLVSSAIALAHSLGLEMVAKGVHSAAAYDRLIGYGCDLAQGLYVCEPLPAVELDLWLARRVGATAAATSEPVA